MSILEKIKKNSTIKEAAVLSKSKFFNEKDMIHTKIYGMNIAFSGDLNGGFAPGLTMWAAPSRHFKSLFSLIMAKAYLDKYPDAVLLFYDCEFGTPKKYFSSAGIDMDRTIHCPILNLEQLKFDIATQLDGISRGDKVIIVIDSIGNIASKKEVEDALEGKSVADMSRAKQLKSLFRIVTPHLTAKDIPCVVINHTYKEQCLAGDTLVRTSEGLKPIQDIKVGDYVYALNGLKPVTYTAGPDEISGEGKEYLELQFDDGSIVKCTHDHKFYTEDGEWVQAIDLKIGESMY